MVFSSHLFVFLFLPAALLAYYAAPHRARHAVLTLLSYAFYGWANPAFVLLMLFSTAVDYGCGLGLERASTSPDAAPRARRALVTLSVVTNLSLLGFFKYFNFAVDSYNAALVHLGLGALVSETVLRVTLPLGISFYTFQSMSYTLDVYRGRSRALRNPIDFACYVSMFPQLVAGPILRFSEVAEQLRERTHSLEKIARGLAFFALGMSKKILLANPCGQIADLTFGAGSLHALDAWWGVLAYAFQIYFDFSGYSDMAIGLGLMLGFVFPKNFDSPYRARTITEFWRRWHLSLSRWLRDYLYIPLGGNRRGKARTYINLALVMLLGGLWHGAAWTFLIWGGVHAAALMLERARRDAPGRLPDALRALRTFLIVLIAWVFFRADSLGHALDYLAAMLGFTAPPWGAGLLQGMLYQPYFVITLAAAAVVTWTAPQTWDFTRRLSPLRAAVCALLFGAALVAMETQGYNPFIYFIF